MQIKKIEKITIITILVILMLISISYASALNSKTNIEKKESPLFRVRTRIAIDEKITDILNNIKTKFIGERLFFKPGERLKFQFIGQVEMPVRYTNKDPYNSCRSYCVCQEEARTYETICGKPRFTCDLCR